MNHTLRSLAALAFALGLITPLRAAEEPAAQPAEQQPEVNVKVIFAANCSWCHDGGGRHAGKGPQLMGTAMSDEQLFARIASGSPGKMPGYASVLKEHEIKAVVSYIRNLQPE